MKAGLIFFFTFYAVFSNAQAETIVLDLKKDVVVSHKNIKLSDIATVNTVSNKRMVRFDKVVLFDSPKPMYSLELTREMIESKLKRHLYNTNYSLAWKGESKIRIERAVKTLVKEKYIRYAEKYLNRELLKKHSNIEIKSVGKYKNIYLPNGDVTLSIIHDITEKTEKRMCVWIGINVDGEQYGKIPVWFSIKAFDEVFVAKKKIEKHNVISIDDFQVEILDIANLSGNPVKSMELISSFRLKNKISKGMVLTSQNTEIIPDVIKGQEVTVNLYYKGIQVETVVTALDSGYLGDVITLENKKSKQKFKALVIGKKRTEIRG